MNKLLLFFSLIMFVGTNVNAQKYFTRDGNITFSSDAPMEKIEAKNSTATCILDTESGRIEFAVLIKAFQFEKALMQEHFNENYMESDKFPKSTFKGNIENISAINFQKDGSYQTKVKGELTIHGVTKEIESEGTFTVKEGKINAISAFQVQVADYKIEIPSVVKDNIAKTVAIDVQLDLQEFKK